MNALGTKQHHILLLGGHDHDRQALYRGLTEFGFEKISEAVDPIAALDIMHAQPVDILITDQYIPFVRFLRTSTKRPAAYIPIIMVCEKNGTAEKQEAVDAGVNRVILKPVTAKLLCPLIKSVLEEPQPFVESAAYIGPDRRRSETDANPDGIAAEQWSQFSLTPEEIAVLLERT